MNQHEQKSRDDMPDCVTWGDSMRGGWLNALSPFIALLVTITGEKVGLPGWLSSLTVLMVWFLGFFVLIRVQFARRHSNGDVFKAFWRTTVLGFALVAGLLAAMYFIR